jgi:pimeloyl-ACP methyl ester carboxylesterase
METAVSDRRAAYLSAYDAVMARWAVDVSCVDIPTVYGATHVNMCGPVDAPPLVLLHGGGCTSTVWFANVGELAKNHRVYAIDQVNDTGRSSLSDTPPRTPADMMAWLDAVVLGLGIERADFCGHSYGSWLALSYAVHAPARVRKLVLLDPSTCFGGFAPMYLIRAAPLMLIGKGSAFFRWETDGAPIDPVYERQSALPSGQKLSKVVMPRRPTADALRALDVPTLVLLAENSKMHDIRKVGAKARALLPNVDVRMLTGQTHHTIPIMNSTELNREIAEFCS